MSAGGMLQAAAVAALKGIEGLGVYDGPPLQAAFPHARVEAGPETDWGYKSGEGRELRLAVTLRDKGERPERIRRLMAEAEARIAAVPPDMEGWRLVTLVLLRSRLVRDGKAQDWAAAIDYRARMLRV